MSINNTVNGGLLQAPKKSVAPIPWNALNLKPKQSTTVSNVTPVSTVQQQRNASSGVIPPSPQTNFTTPSEATVNQNTGGLVTPPPQSPQTPFNQPVKGLFGNVAQSLANTSVQQNPVLNQSTQGLISSAQSNPLEKGGGYDVYSSALQRQSALKKELANKLGLEEGRAIPLEFVQGRQQTLKNQAASQLEAAAQEVSQAQRALGYGIEEQAQQQAGFSQAGGLANTAQGLQQSGLQSAGALAQPSGTFPFVFDPSTGSFTNSGGGVMTPQQAAQAILGKQMTYQQAQESLRYLGQVGDSQLQQAIIAAGGNPQQLQAQGPGQQSVLEQIPVLESANIAAEGVKNKINSFLSANPQLNQNTLAAANLAQQWIEGKQLTDPKYQTLFNYLNEYTNTLAPILGVGGNVTNLKTEIAQGFVNAAASGQSISQVLDSMSRLSTGKIQDMKSGATGGGVVSPSGSNQITTKAADGKDYGFYQDANGKWYSN